MKASRVLWVAVMLALQGDIFAQTTPPRTATPVVPLTFSTSLPLMVIDTGGMAIADDPKIPASLAVISKGAGDSNRPSDRPTGFQGGIGIEVRGTTSQTFPKKQYGFETRDDLGKGAAVGLLGLPPGRSWILSAAYSDPTLLRDAVAYNLARRMGHYASRTLPVELILNGEYQGVYLLEEKLEPAPGRIQLGKQGVLLQITPADRVDPGDVSFKLPEFGTTFVIEFPKGKALTGAMKADIEKAVTSFAFGLYRPDPSRAQPSYLEHVDLNSLADFVLLNEFFKNADAFFASTYLTRDPSVTGDAGMPGKLAFGPVWDLDRGMGNSGRPDLDQPTGWAFQGALFTERLYNDRTFVKHYVQRWHALRKTGVIDSVLADFERDASLLAGPAGRNFTRWPLAGQSVIPGTTAAGRYPAEVAKLKAWLTARAAWMDSNINALLQPGW